MATNGESASRWLEDNTADLSAERVHQVKNNIQQKLETISSENPEATGLLEALDVLEAYLNANSTTALQAATPPTIATTEPGPDITITAAPTLDTSPLIPDTEPAKPLTDQEKKKRFSQLMQENRFKP